MADTGQEIVRRPMQTGGKVSAIIPQSFEEAWRCAQLLCASGMTPKDINTSEKVMATIMAGAEIGMPPFQALQSFAIINGRPALWGDGMLGIVRARGVRVSENLSGDADDMVATCTVTRPDTNEEVTRTFSVADAKAAKLWGKRGRDGQDTPWITYPKRMLQMRARAWAIRDCCADILRGIQMAEEAQDVEVISNERIDAPALPFINGAEKDKLIEDWTARLRQTTAPEDIEAIMAEAEEYKTRLAKNAWDGLEHIAEQETHRVCEGIAPRAPEPSPFEALKAEGLAALTSADPKVAFAKWQAKAHSKSKLVLCSVAERAELKQIEKNIKADLQLPTGALAEEGAPVPETPEG